MSCFVHAGTLILLASVLLSPIGSGGLPAKPAHPHRDEEDSLQAAGYGPSVLSAVCVFRNGRPKPKSLSLLFWHIHVRVI